LIENGLGNAPTSDAAVAIALSSSWGSCRERQVYSPLARFGVRGPGEARLYA
jgi:hypothetical protein